MLKNNITMTFILVIGSGAREVIIVKRLIEDSKKINEDIKIFYDTSSI